MITIILIEDHALVREGFRRILEESGDLRVIGETGDGLEGVDLVAAHRPDVVLVDLQLPGLHGLEVVRRIGTDSPATRIVVLSRHADESYVVESLDAGADAYVLKQSGSEALIAAVRSAAGGNSYLSPPLSEGGLRDYREHAREGDAGDPYRRLTDREREVFQLTAEGATSRAIGARLSISPRTVEKHQAHIREKLGLRSKAEVIDFAHRHGFLDGPSDGG